MNDKNFLIHSSFVVILFFALAGIAMASEIKGGTNSLTCEGMSDRAIAWKINGPDNLIIQSKSAIISADKPLPDGKYRFEIIGYLEKSEIRKPKKEKSLNNGRGSSDTPPNYPVGVIESGHFRIDEGEIVSKDDADE